MLNKTLSNKTFMKEFGVKCKKEKLPKKKRKEKENIPIKTPSVITVNFQKISQEINQQTSGGFVIISHIYIYVQIMT